MKKKKQRLKVVKMLSMYEKMLGNIPNMFEPKPEGRE